jgi:hypothetical protein
MAGGSDPAFVAELNRRADAVRQRVTLSSVIGRDIKLRKSGREQTGLCPFHLEKNDGAFMVNDDKAFYHCFVCGAHGDVIDYVVKRKGEPFMAVLEQFEADAGIDFRDARQQAMFDKAREKREKAALADAARREANAFALWNGAHGLRGTPAQEYLEGRGIDFARLGKFPGAIRFRPDVQCAELGAKIPAMLTGIFNLEGRCIAVHRTYLAFERGDWIKHPGLEKPKMVLGNFYGGYMPLWKGTHRGTIATMPAGMRIGLSEGIEDGLSVVMAAPEHVYLGAVSLDNIGNVQLPPQAGDLTLLRQRDGDLRALLAEKARAAGDEEEAQRHDRAAVQIERSAERAIAKQQEQARAHGGGRLVRNAWPSPGFKDFNDELRGVRMEGA